MEYVELNDLFFNQNTVSFIDKQAEKYRDKWWHKDYQLNIGFYSGYGVIVTEY